MDYQRVKTILKMVDKASEAQDRPCDFCPLLKNAADGCPVASDGLGCAEALEEYIQGETRLTSASRPG